jgi:hypothetical protein
VRATTTTTTTTTSAPSARRSPRPSPSPAASTCGPRDRRASRCPSPGLTLQGLDANPSTITDFDGFSAVAFHAGSATAADGTRFDLETDMRAHRGAYVDAAGARRFGTFAFI